jgi:sulfur transfer protein SufE
MPFSKKKLLKVGNSLAFTIDKTLVNELDLVADKEKLYQYEFNESTGIMKIYFKGLEDPIEGCEIPVFLNVRLTQKMIECLKKMGPQEIVNLKHLWQGANRAQFDAIKNFYLKTGNMYFQDRKLHWVDNPAEKPKVVYPKWDENMKEDVKQHNLTELAKAGLIENAKMLEELDEIVKEGE